MLSLPQLSLPSQPANAAASQAFGTCTLASSVYVAHKTMVVKKKIVIFPANPNDNA